MANGVLIYAEIRGGELTNATWESIAAGQALASALGWGLVINTFSADAAWNNWQGYLLGPLGLGGKDGAWAYANIGVLAALVLSFLLYYLLRSPAVARQEAQQEAAKAAS